MASLDTDLTCAICLELFVDPCSLTCMHSYCKACIISLIKHDSSNNSTLTCPECRHVENIGTRGDYALRKNFTLANIVSKYGVHIQKDTSRQPRTKVEACFTCNDEVSTADVTHASHERTDLKSARKIVTTDIQKRILQIKENNVAEAKEIKRQRKRIAEFRKKELSAVDTVKHEFNISLNELEQRRDSLLQDIKLHSDRVCTQEGAVQKWQEHDGKIKSTLKEIQRCESKEKLDKMKVKDLLQLRSR
ncbi:E3 ubiquitin-protein ligase TRIM62-like [Ostrea edulis]|uniref:E3 ubiquitin-protein ligase TRIM62-like n=1 Tax=Ostrea edulis TaxID=37623 RepID=UPI0024AF8795|nr:E3 ubiquitin-protein ligase TRIM62-like [Ostrea edulis]